jgi:uncharacterized protein (DUF58 family)
MRLVPRTRLLMWTALLVAPLAALAGLWPASLPPALLLIGLLVVLVLFDAACAPGRLDHLSVEADPVTRLSKDRPGHLALYFNNDTARDREIRIGLPLPREVESDREELRVLVPGGKRRSLARWDCTPRRRGNYGLANCYVEAASPLGFWSLRRTLPLRAELRVYPDLTGERKQVAALFLNRGTLGIHTLRQTGKGRDFEKLRDYIPGDSFEDIHWKATAKRGRPVTKVYQIERTQEVYVILDASRLSARELENPARPGTRVSTLERFINAALVLAWAAERQGDLFGLLTFSDRVLDFIRARNGQAHYTLCRDTLYTLSPGMVTPDYDELFAFLRTRLRRRALLVFLTALDDPVLAENFTHNASLVCRQHLMLVNMIQPPGARPLFDAPAATVDDLYQRLGGHLIREKLLELEKSLGRHGVQFNLLANEQLSAQVVTQYLEVRRRQLL